MSLTYARRLGILGRLTGDMKKAKTFLDKHESSLSHSQKNLFGKRFYKAFCTATKIRKSTKEISNHLWGPSQKPRSSGYEGSTRRVVSHRGRGSRDSHQPFRGVHPSPSRVGGRSISFKPRPPSRLFSKGKSVRFRVKGRSPDTQSPTTAFKTSGGSNSVCSSSFTDPRDGHLHFEPTVPLSRAAPIFSHQLETPDTGSVHFQHDRGSLNALCRNPTSGTGASADFSPPARKASNRTRNCGNVTERGSSGGLLPEKGIYQYSFLSQKERWGPVMNLKQLNSLALYQHFKNGETKLAKALNTKGRLDDKTRQERWLIYCANRSTAPTPPSFYLCGHEISIFVPPIWPESSTFSIHQAFEPAVTLLRRLGLRLIISLDDLI